jgi:hypothetical protein
MDRIMTMPDYPVPGYSLLDYPQEFKTSYWKIIRREDFSPDFFYFIAVAISEMSPETPCQGS